MMSEEPDKDSKTEEPTEKKIRDAIEKGNVPFSREARRRWPRCWRSLIITSFFLVSGVASSILSLRAADRQPGRLVAGEQAAMPAPVPGNRLRCGAPADTGRRHPGCRRHPVVVRCRTLPRLVLDAHPAQTVATVVGQGLEPHIRRQGDRVPQVHVQAGCGYRAGLHAAALRPARRRQRHVHGAHAHCRR